MMQSYKIILSHFRIFFLSKAFLSYSSLFQLLFLAYRFIPLMRYYWLITLDILSLAISILPSMPRIQRNYLFPAFSHCPLHYLFFLLQFDHLREFL